MEFWVLLGALLCVLIMYLSMEGSITFWHSSFRREMGFWTFFVTAVGLVILYHPGGPFSSISSEHPLWSLVVLWSAVYYIRRRIKSTMDTTFLNKFASHTRSSRIPHVYVYTPTHSESGSDETDADDDMEFARLSQEFDEADQSASGEGSGMAVQERERRGEAGKGTRRASAAGRDTMFEPIDLDRVIMTGEYVREAYHMALSHLHDAFLDVTIGGGENADPVEEEEEDAGFESIQHLWSRTFLGDEDAPSPIEQDRPASTCRKRQQQKPCVCYTADTQTQQTTLGRAMYTPKAKALVATCHALVEKLSATSSFSHFVFWTGSVERELLAELRDAGRNDLNYCLQQMCVPRMLARTRVVQKELLILLCTSGRREIDSQNDGDWDGSGGRLKDLQLLSKCIVLDALQKAINNPRRKQRFICNIFLSANGDQLSALRTLLDSRGEWHNLHKLVFKDIESESIREVVLHHIEMSQPYARIDLGASATTPTHSTLLKILSDIDDTLLASGGPPGGVDRRLPKHHIYPGVLEFYRQLDITTDDCFELEGDDESLSLSLSQERPLMLPGHGNLTFLSARPHIYKGFTEAASYKKFRDIIESQGMHTTPNLLAGDVRSSVPVLVGRMNSIAIKKFLNFRQYQALYPEYGFVFVGDNGQGDVQVAKMMLHDFSNVVHAVFIHVVKDLSKEDKEAAHEKMFFVNTFVDAALAAHSVKLLNGCGVVNVARKAWQTYCGIKPSASVEKYGVLLREAISKVNDRILEGVFEGSVVDVSGDAPRGEG